MKTSLQTRLVVFYALKDILEKKMTLPSALARSKFFSSLSVADSKFVRLLLLETLRHYAQAKVILNQYAKKKFSGKKRDIEYVLILAIVQLKFLKTPSHAAVDTAVELSKEIKQRHFSGLVNAILHAISRDDKALPDVLCNIPDWLLENWLASYGKDQVQSFVEVFNSAPTLDISVKENAPLWAQKLGGTLLENGTIRCDFTDTVPNLEGFDEGAWWVQELSASLPAQLFSDVKGKRGADLCAAPGGKTAQLVVRGALVDAYDISEKRLEKLKENLSRLKMEDKVNVICSDALQIKTDELYDFILLDAPCSATGTIKRHPDLMYLRTREDIVRLSHLQRELLEHAFTLLKKGGELVYSTCSLECEENEELVQSFLKDHINIKRITPNASYLKPFLNAYGAVQVCPKKELPQDGFYAVLLKKE